jgi:hypothetical protein
MGLRDSKHVPGDERRAEVGADILQPLLGDLPERSKPGVGPSDSIRCTSEERVILDLDGKREQLARGREATDGGGVVRPTPLWSRFQPK